MLRNSVLAEQVEQIEIDQPNDLRDESRRRKKRFGLGRLFRRNRKEE
jgi:hypothetical protein